VVQPISKRKGEVNSGKAVDSIGGVGGLNILRNLEDFRRKKKKE
jgi:hypothetical protein